ncbi:hypothetical protein LJR015_004007 [Peribacillus frigoritolerans]|uniref:hypothetical protein n=1 Tax=Peribacillus frigoritolerans TaxID=450367 RepID=UPI003ECF331D
MLEDNIRSAIHWWRAENDLSSSTTTISWVFKTGEALYQAIEVLATGIKKESLGMMMGGSRNFVINLRLTPAEYFHLRGILAMTADMYRITTAIVNNTETGALKPHLNKIKRSSNKFRDLRNFFEHIDDRLINLNEHGISGETNTNCGISYQENTVDCFHLVFDGTSFHFSDEKKAKERSFTVNDFTPIFEGLEGLYNVLTSHKTFSEDYPPFSSYCNFKNLVN